jgi:hypothetical protein
MYTGLSEKSLSALGATFREEFNSCRPCALACQHRHQGLFTTQNTLGLLLAVNIQLKCMWNTNIGLTVSVLGRVPDVLMFFFFLLMFFEDTKDCFGLGM